MSLSRSVLVLPVLLASLAPASAEEVRGKIVQVDTEASAVRLAGRRPERGRGAWLYLTPETRIDWGKEPATKADLTVGRRVVVTFAEIDGRKVVRSVLVLGLRPRTPPASASSVAGLATGVLWRVALTERDVVVVGPGAKGPATETTVWVEDGVQVFRDGKAVAYEALNVGEKATVRFELRTGRRVAVSIHAGKDSAPGPAAPAAPAGPAAPEGGRPLIQKARVILRLVDWGLGQLEKRQDR